MLWQNKLKHQNSDNEPTNQPTNQPVLVLIRFQKYNFSFYSVLVRKIILVLVLVLVNDW